MADLPDWDAATGPIWDALHSEESEDEETETETEDEDAERQAALARIRNYTNRREN